jgi:hypothetical protein
MNFFLMTGQEKRDLLIQVTTWAGLTVAVFTCMYNKTLLWQSQNEQ